MQKGVPKDVDKILIHKWMSRTSPRNSRKLTFHQILLKTGRSTHEASRKLRLKTRQALLGKLSWAWEKGPEESKFNCQRKLPPWLKGMHGPSQSLQQPLQTCHATWEPSCYHSREPLSISPWTYLEMSLIYILTRGFCFWGTEAIMQLLTYANCVSYHSGNFPYQASFIAHINPLWGHFPSHLDGKN